MGEPIAIRAHLCLCLLGFRGEGYSVTFVSEMSRLFRELEGNPERMVRLITSPDRICRSCVHLQRGGCTLGGPEHEEHMRRHDEEVLGRLGLAPEGVYRWNLVKARVAASIEGADLPGLCTTCPWLDLGWCAEAVDALPAPVDVGRGDAPPPDA